MLCRYIVTNINIISQHRISGKSDLDHCRLPIAGAPPQLVKTACLSLHTSDRIRALGVLVCWQQFILMRCHNMEFFYARHQGAKKVLPYFFECQMLQVWEAKGEPRVGGGGGIFVRFIKNWMHFQDKVKASILKRIFRHHGTRGLVLYSCGRRTNL